MPQCGPTDCDAGVSCGMCLQLLPNGQCPDGPHALAMPDCQPGEEIGVGQLCVANNAGECGTDIHADNCLYEVVKYVYQSWDVYKRISCTFSPSLPPPSLPPWPLPPPSKPSPPDPPHPPMTPGYNNATLEYVTSPPDEGVIIGVAIPLGLLFLVVIGLLVKVYKKLQARRKRILLSSGPSSHITVVDQSKGEVQLDDFEVVGTTTAAGVDAKAAAETQGATRSVVKGSARGSCGGAHGMATEAAPKERKSVSKAPLIKTHQVEEVTEI